MVAAFSELLGARELFRNFLVRDLNARYKGSVFGIAWSLLNPLLMMAVYTVVFSVIVKVQVEHGHYPVFFLAGFLPWTFFVTSLQQGSSTLVAHAGLIQKVYFPREVLPLSITAANLVNLGLSLAIFLPFAWITYGVDVLGLLVLLPVTLALVAFTAGLAMLLAALVVYFRDVEFLIGVLLQAWFFVTPVIWPPSQAPESIKPWLLLNPISPFIRSYHQAIYDLRVPEWHLVAVCLLLGASMFLAGYAGFNRLKARIAEEL